MIVEPMSQRQQCRMSYSFFQEAPEPGDMDQIARFSVAITQASEYTEDLAMSLGAQQCAGKIEGIEVDSGKRG